MAALIATAVIWGAGFIATQIALDASFTVGFIMLLRFAIASAALMVIFNRKLFPLTVKELLCGAVIGLILFAGFYVQAIGLKYSSLSSNGFLTSTNVIMVPFISWAMIKKRPKQKAFWASLICLAGIFILTYTGGGFALGKGEILTLVSAFLFATHISFLGAIAGRIDTLKLTFLQMFFAFFYSIPVFLANDLKYVPDAQIWKGLPAIIYLGLFSTGLCYLLETYAQTRVSPSTASVVMSTEALWCAVFSVIIGYEKLTVNMVAGGLIIMFSVVWVESNFGAYRKIRLKR